MPIDQMVKEATGLPDKYVEMAVSYIHFLQFQFRTESAQKPEAYNRKLGILSDKFHSIADDFDDTPDCFEEYV